MDRQTIIQFIKDGKNWTKDKANEDLWTYAKLSPEIAIGRQRFDWAIFIKGKNKGFFFGENYADIPEGLIGEILSYSKCYVLENIKK